jgi:YVTN family beta-propeller protein
LDATDGSDSLGQRLYLPLVASLSATQPNPRPSWGAPIALSPNDGSIWVVNPDAGSITSVDPDRLIKQVEIVTGGEPWSLAFSPDGATLYVVDRANGLLVVVDVANAARVTTVPVGPEPGAVALSSDGKRAYVTITAANRIAVVETASHAVVAQIAVAPLPYALAVSHHVAGQSQRNHQGEQLYVTHLLALPRPGGAEASDDGREGRITVIDSQTLSVTQNIVLPPDEHGFPNLLTSITLSRNWAWIPHVRAAPALPNGLTTTLFAAVSTLDRVKGKEDSAAHLALNDEQVFGSPVNNPIAAIPAPDGKTLYVVLAGSNLVEVVDITDPYRPLLVKFLPAGQNPRGMAISADGRRGYVMSYLARTVTVLDLAHLAWVAELPVTSETLDAAVLRGKILFNTAADPRLARTSWLACASCHPDSGSDSVTWIFPDGPRQTPALWNSGQTLPWHWSAALDEAQDVEDTIQTIQHGIGLAPGPDAPLLSLPNAGRSSDLDALAAFLLHGIRPPVTSTPAPDSRRGRQLFVSLGCAACHGGKEWTSSALPSLPGALDPDGNGMVDAVLHKVGTATLLDRRGATGFDAPSLLGVGLTAPYFHDGSMPTLEKLIRSGHPLPGGSVPLPTDEEVQALAGFLRSIGANTTPVSMTEESNTKGVPK